MLTSEPKTYAGEAQHWYWPKSGEPCHQLPYKDKKRKGELRNTTLRDARELGLYPSVSAILGVVEKKGLDGWKKEQVAKAACSIDWWSDDRNGASEFETESRIIPLILQTAEAQMTKARDLGTEIHGAIERYLQGAPNLGDWSIPDEWDHSLHIKAAVAALKELEVWGQPFSAERTFASPLGYGGTVDFQSELIIVDFKCVDRLDKKLTYDDRVSQLCGYFVGNSKFPKQAEGLLYKARLVNCFICTSEPGEYLLHEWPEEDKERGWLMFCRCFDLWKIINRYDPLKHVPS